MLNSAKNLYQNLQIVRKRKTQKSKFWRPHKDLQVLPKVAHLGFQLLFLSSSRWKVQSYKIREGLVYKLYTQAFLCAISVVQTLCQLENFFSLSYKILFIQ
jgi:hypothetical protein